MAKYISCGKWYKNYLYILLSLLFTLLHDIFYGFSIDGEEDFKIDYFKQGNFSDHYLIHEIYSYFFCIILAFALILLKKGKQYRRKKQQSDNESSQSSQKSIFKYNSFAKDLTLIYSNEYKNINISDSKRLIFLTIFAYIFLEQFNYIYGCFFPNMDFWMIELYILAYLNLKIFHIEIFKHQKLAFAFVFISIIINVITVVMAYTENDIETALYVRYWQTIFIPIILYPIFALILSYTFINIKKLIDLKFISLRILLFIYGISGFIFCCLLCMIANYIKCDQSNMVANYMLKVDDNNYIYWDNFGIYFDKWKKNEKIEKINEGITSFFGSFFYALYKYYDIKILQMLTPFHKILAYPLYYFCQKLIAIFSNLYKIKEKKIFPHLLIVDLVSDFFSIVGYIIYLEIIELKFCGFNYNLRRNIIKRGDRDFSYLISEYDITNEEGESSQGESDSLDYNSNSEEMY